MIIDCGAFTDNSFVGGIPYTTGNTIDLTGVTGALPQEYYQTCRYTTSTFGYVFSNLVPGAVYNLRLHSADPYFATPGNRIGKITVNGTVIAAAYDIVAEAGSINKAVVLEFATGANSDGAIFLVVDAVASNPLICAIEVNKAVPGPGTPPSSAEQKAAWTVFASQCYGEFLRQGLSIGQAEAKASHAANLLLEYYNSRWTS